MIFLAWLIGCLMGAALGYRRKKPWVWSREPRPYRAHRVMEEIEPALQNLNSAASRLSQYMWNGWQVAKAIEHAERYLEYAKRHIKIVDPDEPTENEPEFML